MAVFCLYRLKVERSRKSSLFGNQLHSSSEVILSAIESKPLLPRKRRAGPAWRIGNIQIYKKGVFFALGKITKETRAFYDEESGDFVEHTLDEAPHTYVAIDLELQVCAIARKASISSKVKNIAENLEKLLNAALHTNMNYHGLVLTLSEISDPEEFIASIRNASCVYEFEMTFSPPNPFDVEQQFHKPMEELLKASRANKGKTSVQGQDLDQKVIEDLARSVASSGNNAKARIQIPGEEKPVRKNLSGDPVTVSIDDMDTSNAKRNLFQKIRKAYSRVTGSELLP